MPGALWLLASILFVGALSGPIEARNLRATAPVGDAMSAVRGHPNPDCPQFQVFGFPTAKSPGVLERSYSTCRLGYAGMFDPELNSPLWVAERLSRDGLKGDAHRAGLDFKDDPQIPQQQEVVRHYRRSEFDKGHLAAAADFRWSQEAMRQSFIYSNAVPQHPWHKRNVWQQLESMVRELAGRRGTLFVVTGPVFGQGLEWLHYGKTSADRQTSAVPVPSALFKVIVDPSTREMTAFVIPNDGQRGEDPRPYQLSVREVEKVTGLDFNPQLSRIEADSLEVNSTSWVLPQVRKRFLEGGS
jgi:endonuclease G